MSVKLLSDTIQKYISRKTDIFVDEIKGPYAVKGVFMDYVDEDNPLEYLEVGKNGTPLAKVKLTDPPAFDKSYGSYLERDGFAGDTYLLTDFEYKTIKAVLGMIKN